MPLQSGTRLGPYEIVTAIGAGGMGEVYRARDTQLQRDVAIKILPELFAADAERLARFQREAQVLAALKHPGIAAIYGLEDGPAGASHGGRALVLELVEGEDLAERLTRGPIPLDEALPIARQIAEALEAAHEQGIIHRDLKPANIKVTPDGTVKVLDFGLAKALDPSGVGSDAAVLLNSPTFTGLRHGLGQAATELGMILGTAAYMAPEQAKGKPADKRADIWAFGVVLFEMLTGGRLFEGESVAETIGLIVTHEPDLSRLPAATPDGVRALLVRCLERDPKKRLRDVGEARIALTGIEVAASAIAPGSRDMSASRRGGRAVPIAAALLLAGVLTGVAVDRFVLAPASAPRQPDFAFDVLLPGQRIDQGSIAVSPDGAHIVFLARGDSGAADLWIRDLGSAEARVLPGTRGAVTPFWAPDSRHLAFFVGRDLLRLPLDGGSPRRIASLLADPLGGTWNGDDVILFGTDGGPVFRLHASGGAAPVAVTTVETGVEEHHAWPEFLPDGKRFVYLADASTAEGHRVHYASLDAEGTTILMKGIRSQPRVDPAGALLVAGQNQLVAHPFDLRSGTLGTDSHLIADGVFTIGDRHQLPAAVARNGILVYQLGIDGADVVRVDLAGVVQERLSTVPERFGGPAVSPDGRSLAFDIRSANERLIWAHDLERGVRTLLSERGRPSDNPSWSADGEAVYFASNRDGTWEVYRQTVDGAAEPERMPKLPASDVVVLDCSSDGRYLLIAAQVVPGNWDLMLLPLDRSGADWQGWLATPAVEDGGRFSPDSRWIAYSSNETGRTEIYLSAIDGSQARRLKISSDGGTQPAWSPDGRRIFYRSPVDQLVAVDVTAVDGRIRAGAPVALFDLESPGAMPRTNVFDVTPDGKGFIVLRRPSDQDSTIRVRSGWRTR